VIQIIPCKEYFEELVQFVSRLNSDGAHHIGFFGEGEADIRASLAECVVPPEDCFLMAYDDDHLVGVFGVDTNPEIHRAWLFGPLVEHEDWHLIADLLYQQVKLMIPNEINEYDLYCDEQNTHMDEFASRYGFPMRSQTAVLNLSKQTYKPAAEKKTKIIPFENSFFEAFHELHDKTFPNTYFTAGQIVEKINESRQLFIAVDDARLLGYIFCKVDETGYIDFLGTDENVRGRRIGSDLLAAALDWMLSTPEINSVNLTVQADNAIARHLYDKFGFTTTRVMNGYRKTGDIHA